MRKSPIISASLSGFIRTLKIVPPHTDASAGVMPAPSPIISCSLRNGTPLKDSHAFASSPFGL